MRPELFVFDLDGTLYRGSEPAPHAVDVLRSLRDEGAGIRFLTNNSSKTRAQIAQRLRSMGFEADDSEVYTSAMGAARWLQAEGVRRAFVVGEPGLVETLAEAGVESVEEGAEAVVAGICRSFDYAWLDRALQCLVHGARFVATNTDATYPMEGGAVQPGGGAIVAAIAACSGIHPVVIGKPEPFLLEWLLEEAGTSPSSTLVVGDRLETDIEAGIRAGCQVLMVGTGVTVEPPVGIPFAADLRVLVSG